MAEGVGSAELKEETDTVLSKEEPRPLEEDISKAEDAPIPVRRKSDREIELRTDGRPKSSAEDHEDRDEEDDEVEEDDEDDEEPRLKYAPLTKNLGAVYRNGDSTSTFMVVGDKLIVGTHNGAVHVLSVPLLQTIKSYKAHDASVTSISISPYPPPLPIPTGRDASQRLASETVEHRSSSTTSSPQSKGSPKPPPVPKAPSNEIYIATSSIDGHVCVASLIDSRDVQKRNFGRPVQAVALSPDYKNDKTYLSGGQAGNLTLTVGGQAGRRVNATTTGAAAVASGWLGVIGIGSSTGTDKNLHHGEGTINTIKWSLSGKYVLWVNEEGIKIKRSHLLLEEIEAGLEWKTIAHINRPNRKGWGEMAIVQKARAEWIDRGSLESDRDILIRRSVSRNGSAPKVDAAARDEFDEVVAVGWGDMTWIVKIIPARPGQGGKIDSPAGKAEVISIIRFDDCMIAGVSLYTPTMMLVLAYMEKKQKNADSTKEDTPRKRGHRTTGLKPELRLIDITTKEELETDPLSVSRFESLASSDYHLGVLYPLRIPTHLMPKGYLSQIGSGVATGVSVVSSGLVTSAELMGQGVQVVGQGMWDATMYAPRRLGAQRLFSSNDATGLRSKQNDPFVSASPAASTKGGMSYLTGWIPGLGSSMFAGADDDLRSVATTQGLKIFIFSPYDCIVAVKRTLSDRLQWLEEVKQYQKAWELLNEHPEAAGSITEPSEASTPPTPSKASSITPSTANSVASPSRVVTKPSLAEFFADTQSLGGSPKPDKKSKFSSAEKEKRRIGELWLQQLIKDEKWVEAGEIAEKVLNTTPRWEHWVWQFIRNNKFDEISPHIPTMELTPPLSPSIFEIVLGHYVTRDAARFKELVDVWPSDLFEVGAIVTAIQDQLGSGSVQPESGEWRLLNECLAKLYLADGHYKEALRCYIQLHDADTAMSLVRDHHLVEGVVDDIPGFVLLRIPRSQLPKTPPGQLEMLSADSIRLLVAEASHGVLEPQRVIDSLRESGLTVFVYFYLKGLWVGISQTESYNIRTRHRFSTAKLAADEGKSIVEDFADLAVEIFAEYDRPLLMEFLHTSVAYDFDRALQICGQKRYVDEEVFLLAKTGALKKALYLIIDELQDVSKAIAFAKEQDDSGLWEDLLEYSMSRPKFISGLLAEVGTAIDPIKLVRRIPSGIEIEGLKDGLRKMVREYDLQDSISAGVAQVLSSEVAIDMDILRRGRRRGIKFEVESPLKRHIGSGKNELDPEDVIVELEPRRGHCAGCEKVFTGSETETLVGFACGHVYHLSHMFEESDSTPKLPSSANNNDDEEDGLMYGMTRSIATKVTNARLLRDKVQQMGGCRKCREKMSVVGLDT